MAMPPIVIPLIIDLSMCFPLFDHSYWSRNPCSGLCCTANEGSNLDRLAARSCGSITPFYNERASQYAELCVDRYQLVIRTSTVATCAESKVETAVRVMDTGAGKKKADEVSNAMREELRAVS